ncbi:hypothetical protein [Propioniferax innocua]|uniref:Uncharacterized protein n=1 Tax=Propioniferax innocua TaxID=1753 RepID=A0A542ZBN2_9ACTN|nr:hypothetical protein [Propioniferax innocua]TQL57742.1 hypothetical protein FB460_1584 [Propioniferax innocua]
MLNVLLPLAGEGSKLVNETPIPAPFIGLIALAMLLIALTAVRGVGHGRPHSEGDGSEGN